MSVGEDPSVQDARIPLKIISLYSRVNELLDAIAQKHPLPTLSLVPVGEPFPTKAAQRLSFVQISDVTAQKVSFFVNTKLLIVLTHWMEDEQELQALYSLCSHAKARGTIVVTILVFNDRSKITFHDHPHKRLLLHFSDLIIPLERTNAVHELDTFINYLRKDISAFDETRPSRHPIIPLLRAANFSCLGGVIPKQQLLDKPEIFHQIIMNLPKTGFMNDSFDLKQVVIWVQQDSEAEFSKFKTIHQQITKLNPILPLKWYLLPPNSHKQKFESKHAIILIFKELKGFKTNKQSFGISSKIVQDYAHSPARTPASTSLSPDPKPPIPMALTPPANSIENGQKPLLLPPPTSRYANREDHPQLIQSLKNFSNIIEKDPEHGPVKEIEVYVFDEGGITLGHFGKGTIRSCNDPTLITGLFSAIQTFAHDVIGGKPRYIETNKLRCVFDVRNFTTVSASGKSINRTITGVALYPVTIPNRFVVPHLNYCLDIVQDLLSRGISESECAEVVDQILESGGLTSAVFPRMQEQR